MENFKNEKKTCFHETKIKIFNVKKFFFFRYLSQTICESNFIIGIGLIDV